MYGRAHKLISMGVVFWLGLAESYARTRPPTSGALNCRSRNFSIEFASAPVQAPDKECRNLDSARTGRTAVQYGVRSYELRAMRRYKREAAKRRAIAQSAVSERGIVLWMVCSSGGLSSPDRRFRSATLACGSPGCPERRASTVAGLRGSLLTTHCSVPEHQAAAYQRVESREPRVRPRNGLTAEGLHLEATLGPGGGVHVLARQTVAAICDTSVMQKQ